MASTLNVSLVIKAFDRATAPMRAVTRNFQAMRDAKIAADRQFARAGNIRNAAEGVKRFSDAAVNAMKAPISEFENFEAAMSRVRAVTKDARDATGPQFKALSDEAKRLGATTRFTAEQAAQGFGFLGMAGFSAAEQLTALPPMLDLATAGGTDLGRTADIVSDLLGAFNLSAADTTAMTDQLAVTMTGANVTLETMFETMKLAGPIATKLNVSMSDVAAMTGLMGSAGIKGSMAGTALRAAMNRLVDPTDKAQTALQKMNVRLTDQQGNLRPMTDLLAEIQAGTEGMGTALRGAIVAEVFGVRAMSAMTTLMEKTKAGEIKKFAAEIQNSGGAAREMAQIMDANAKGATIRLMSAFSGLMTQVGEKLEPTLTSLKETITETIQAMTEWVQRNPRLTRALAIVAGTVTILATTLTALMFTMAAFTTAMGVMRLGLGGWKTAITLLTGAVKKLFVQEVAWQVVSARSGAMTLVKTRGITTLAKMITTRAIPALIGMATGAWSVAAGVIAATWPILLIAAAIAAAIAVVYLAIKHWDRLVEIFERFKKASLATKIALGLLLAPIIAILSPLLAIAYAAKQVIAWWGPVKTFFQDLWGSIVGWVQEALDWFSKLELPEPLKKFMGLMAKIGSPVVAAAKAVGGAVSDVASKAAAAVKDVAKEARFVVTGEATIEPPGTIAETIEPVANWVEAARAPAGFTMTTEAAAPIAGVTTPAAPVAAAAPMTAATPMAAMPAVTTPAAPATEAVERVLAMAGAPLPAPVVEGPGEGAAARPFLAPEAGTTRVEIGEGLLHIKIDSDRPARVVGAEQMPGLDLDIDTGFAMATAG